MINKTILKLFYSSRLSGLKATRNIFGREKNFFYFSKQGDLEKISKKNNQLDQIIPQIKKNHEPDAGIFSVDRVIDREQAGQQLKERLEKLRKKHDLLRIQIKQKIDIPFLLCGINRKTYHQSFGYLPQRVMNYYRIHPTTVTDYLLKIYKASLYSIVDKNISFMDEYWESGFKQNVLKSLEIAKQKKYNIKISEQKNFLQQMRQSCKIVDAVMVRGISIDRSKNQAPSYYHRFTEDKEFGLITYTPLYLTQDNQKFSNPETNKTIYQGYQKMIMRVLLLIKTPIRLIVPQLPIPQQLNTYEHLVVIQNQMVAPPHLQSRYKIETLVQWLGKYRFGQWRVVDIDNFMRGNSPFRLHNKQEQLDQIFRNTNLDKSYYCNIRNL